MTATHKYGNSGYFLLLLIDNDSEESDFHNDLEERPPDLVAIENPESEDPLPTSRSL